MSALAWFGKMAKAEVRDGKPFLTFLVTGPEIDKTKERVTKAVCEKVSTLAKAGKVFLAPSHDVPIALAKSVDSKMDAEGHTWIEFEVDQADPMAMKVFKGYETGEWSPTVSLGAEKVTRTQVFDLGKTIMEVSDLDETKPVHTALAFPGREAYQFAGIAQAMRKALSSDPEELKKRFWPEASIQKAMMADAGWPPPPSFADRWNAKQIQEDMPDMMQLLRWCIEDAVSPYTAGTPEEKRGLAVQSLNEFLDTVLGCMDEAGMGKTVAKRADTSPKEGKGKYGSVDFADETNKKYPIDTAEHIRAAWNYINKTDNAAKYSAADLKTIKGKIVSAWKKVIDKDGPPSAKKAEGAPAEGMAKTDDPPATPPPDPTSTESEEAPSGDPGSQGGESEPSSEGAQSEPEPASQEGAEAPNLEKSMKALTEMVTGLVGTVSEVKGQVEALQGMTKTTEPPPPAPEPEGKTTDPASAPHTGVGMTSPAGEQDGSALKTLKEEESRLRKVISETRDASMRAKLSSEHDTVVTRIQRMEMGY